jgi:hypothetical protein
MGSASTVHPTAGLVLEEKDGRVFIRDILAGTPCAKIPQWKTRLHNATIVGINDNPVSTIADAATIIANLPQTTRGTCRLLVTASELRDGLTNEGIPQISLDQLNPRHFFRIPSHTGHHSNNILANMIRQSWDGGVLQYLTRANKLTRGVLIKQSDWLEWQQSEFLQLDQYELQGMFGDPVLVSNNYAVFNLVWTYAVKEVDGRKKARCTCDGSTRGGQVRVLDYTPTQTVLIKHVLGSSMLWRQLRIWLYLERMCQMLSQRPLRQSKGSTFDPILHSMRGGPSTRDETPSHHAMSSLSCQRCRVIQKHLGYGKNTPTKFSDQLDSHQLPTSHAYTQALWTVIEYSSFDRLMILLSRRLQKQLPPGFLTISMNN